MHEVGDMPPEQTSDGYLRFHVALIFDVPPERFAKYPDGMQDAFNAALSRIVELAEEDPKLQSLLRRHQIDFGWEKPTWES
ncbi:MAG: hypothetical protein RI985_1968 [Chloroflexota bacterium]|jgi:hypothetical protein